MSNESNEPISPNQQKMADLLKEAGDGLLLSGRLQFQIDEAEEGLETLKAQLHNARLNVKNLNAQAKKIQAAIDAEAKAAALEIKLAEPAPAAPIAIIPEIPGE